MADGVVTSLSVRDFRCFESAAVEFHPELTFLLGANAQGKTSVLEAVCVMLRLQSPRTSRLAHVIRHGAQGLVVDGYFGKRHLQFYYSAKKRKLALDSVEQSRSHEYLDIGRVVYMANDDIQLVRSGADIRRKFLDFIGQQAVAGYRRVLREFARVLRSRNHLLKTGGYASRKELPAFTEQFIARAKELTLMRGELVTGLSPAVARAYTRISESSAGSPELELEYAPGSGDDLEDSLDKNAEEEARLGQTVAGPHRDDLQLLQDGVPAREFASEGQQRTIVLAMRLAQCGLIHEESGLPPVLLIDDIFGELDKGRRNRMLAELPAHTQKIITATDIDWKAARHDESVTYSLKDNRIVRENG